MYIMKVSYSIFILLLLLVPSVIAISYDDKNTLNTEVTITNSFTLVPTDSSYNIKYVNLTVVAYPRSDVRQSVIETVTSPETDISNLNSMNQISFLFNNPLQSSYDISIVSKVNTINMINEISSPINFPLNNLDSSLYQYVQPTKIIDVTPEIKDLASELIGDKKDMYEVEYVLAEYVRKNVAYDLGTLTSDVNQKSSWVLANKIGVCDEITNLFISLNRAAGIPARFVSGVAYTNLDSVFGKNWVPHAWAEVYFPGVGWVPYDVTYGQYGFIDAGHIKLLDSQESSGSDVSYNYLGYNMKLQPGPIGIDVKVLDYGDNAHGRYNFVAKVYDNETGFGSYDMISVQVENDKPYYQVADLYLAETQGMHIIEASKETVLNKTIHRKQVLLRPHETSTIYWLIQVDNNLDKNYVYTLPLVVYNTYNETSTTFLQSRKDYTMIDYDYFQKLLSSEINSTTDESLKPYSKNIYLDCTSDKNNIYLEDSVNIDCVLDNQGDKTFDNMSICMDNNCTTRTLVIQKIPLHYSKNFESVGLKNVEIKTYSNELGKEFTKISYIPINVLDKPKIDIIGLNAPDTVNYGDTFDISFTLSKSSISTPKNIRLLLKSETNKIDWVFPDFDGDKAFTVKSAGDSMKPDKNNYKITVFYEDDKGNQYTSEKDFVIVSKATFLERILLYINLIGRSIEQVFTG